MFQYLYAQGKFEKSLNATFIALIPKESNVVDVMDFTPKNTFVKGRHILDSSLIANDCFASRLKTGKPWLFCKLDVENIYAYIN